MKVRTIKSAVDEIRSHDSNTAITEWAIRKAITEGKLPYKLSGNKYLVTIEAVESFFGGFSYENI